MKKRAFTLAEVLITIAVIGIVAAMVLPTLISNYKSKAWNTAAEVFRTNFTNATKQMNVDQNLTGYNSTGSFVNALSSYMKISKICDKNHLTECFPDKIYWSVSDDSEPEEFQTAVLTNASALGQEDWETDTVGLMFANGTTAILAYNNKCSGLQQYTTYANGETNSCISMVFDTSGMSSPNTSHKDIRTINAELSTCSFKVDGVCTTAVFIPNPAEILESQEFYNNLLGITYNRPIQSSLTWSDDYWAAARYSCQLKGMDLPTPEQMAQIGSYIYGTKINSTEEYSGNVEWDVKKLQNTPLADTLASKPYGASYWTKVENGSSGSYYQKFALKQTFYTISGRNQPTTYAFCVR